MTYVTGSTALTRDLNRIAVLRMIGASGPIARTHLAARLGLSPATVTSLTRELLDRGVIREASHAPSNGGRPAVLLELVGGAANALGVKIAPDHVVGVRVDLDAQILDRYEAAFDASDASAIEELVRILESWLNETAGPAPLLGVGLGVPGVFDGCTGKLDSPLLGWRDVELARILHERLHLPVFVDNDVNTLAVAERLCGRARDIEHFITVTIGRGVGLGIIAGGDIYRGFRGGAGEFGHTTAVEGGPWCTCGKRGCLEAVVADPALVEEARRRRLLSKRQGIARLRALASAGDPEAEAVYADAAATLGRAVADLVNVLGPELVLISGEGTEAWSHMASGFERAFRANLFPPLGEVSVEIDPWDDAKWAVGAAALVLRATFVAGYDEQGEDLSVRARLKAKPSRSAGAF